MNDSLIDRSEFEKRIDTLDLPKPLMLDDSVSLLEALTFIQEKKIGCLLLHKDNKLSGVITERDYLLRVVGKIDNWREVPCHDVMVKNPYTLLMSDKIIDVIKVMTSKDFRHLPILNDQGEVERIVSVKDLLALLVNFFKEEVESVGVMTEWTYANTGSYSENFSLLSGDDSNISGSIFFAELKRAIYNKATCISHTATIQDALQMMQNKRVGSLLVMEYETKIVGIITERDFLFKFFGKISYDDIRPVTDFMTPKPHLLLHRHYLAHAINNMLKFKYRNTIVVNEDKFPMSLVGLLEIFRYLSLHLFK
jgi:CBS domain-containing protein